MDAPSPVALADSSARRSASSLLPPALSAGREPGLARRERDLAREPSARHLFDEHDVTVMLLFDTQKLNLHEERLAHVTDLRTGRLAMRHIDAKR
jgi:hypothetical protein